MPQYFLSQNIYRSITQAKINNKFILLVGNLYPVIYRRRTTVYGHSLWSAIEWPAQKTLRSVFFSIKIVRDTGQSILLIEFSNHRRDVRDFQLSFKSLAVDLDLKVELIFRSPEGKLVPGAGGGNSASDDARPRLDANERDRARFAEETTEGNFDPAELDSRPAG